METKPLPKLLDLLPQVKPPVPGAGEVVCPTCEGMLFVVSASGPADAEGKRWHSISRCHCGGGLVNLCPHCGEPALYDPASGSHSCVGSRAVGSRAVGSRAANASRTKARQLSKWLKAGPQPWTSSSQDHVWSEGLDKHLTGEELEDAWWEHCGSPKGETVLPPIDPEWALLYATRDVRLTYDASNILEHWNDEHGGDDWSPADSIDDQDVSELQAMLDAWCAKVTACVHCYEADFAHALLPPALERTNPPAAPPESGK